jgi:hypothetical protein
LLNPSLNVTAQTLITTIRQTRIPTTDPAGAVEFLPACTSPAGQRAARQLSRMELVHLFASDGLLETARIVVVSCDPGGSLWHRKASLPISLQSGPPY